VPPICDELKRLERLYVVELELSKQSTYHSMQKTSVLLDNGFE